MSIWRAPLLIIGILLVLLAAAALAAPWFVDWNRYRPRLEEWGRAITGHEVTIAGDVDFVLFPWPAARLHKVRVASVPGSRFEHLLTVDEVQARFSLGALFGGRLEVESVRLVRPTLALEHLRDGHGNWRLTPHARVRLPFAPERVAIDTVRIENGRLLLADRRLRSQLRISDINARVRAPRLIGPWRITGTASLLGRRWRLRATTGEIRPQAPVSLSLRLEPPERENGFVFRLDGDLARDGGQPRFRGRMQLQPVLGSKRGDPLDPARQVDLRARVRLDAAALELTELKITPRFPATAPFDAVAGRMRMEFGPALNTSLLLRTARLRITDRLDRLLGLEGADTPAAAGLSGLRRHLKALAARLPALPPELLLQLDVQATTLNFNGRAYTAASLSAEATRELFTIRHLRANAANGTRLSFRGNLLAGDMVQLTGELAVKTADARALLFGFAPDARELLDGLWRGAPGSFDLLATLDLTDDALRLVSRRLRLDDAPARLDWRHTTDRKGRPRNEITFSADRLDLDSWRGAAGMADVRPLLSPVDADFSLLLNVTELRLVGLPWKNTQLELLHTPRAIRIDALKVADLAGLALQGGGAFHRPGWQEPWRGDLSIRLRGDDASALWRALGGLATAETPPDWLRRLGAIDLRLTLRAAPRDMADTPPDAARPVRLSAHLKGKTGPVDIDLDVNGNSTWTTLADGQWDVRAEVKSPKAAPLLALARMPATVTDGPFHFALRAEGTPNRAMRATTRLQLPGLRLRYEGDARLPSERADAFPPLQGAGRLAWSIADAAWPLRHAGLYAPAAMATEGEARLAFSPGHLALRKLDARLGDATIGGEMKLAWPLAEPPSLWARLAADRADLRELLRLLLSAPDNPVRLREHLAAGWRPDVELRADEMRLLAGGWRLPDALLRIEGRDENTLRLELKGGRRKTTLTAQTLLRRVPLGLQARGGMRADLPLHRLLRFTEGAMRLRGQATLELSFAGRTVTLPGFLPVLQGKGTLRFRQAVIEGLSPDRLLRALRRITDEKALKRFRALVRENLHAGDWPLPEKGAVDLRLASGMLELAPLEYAHAGLTTRIGGLMDPAQARLDITLEFSERGERTAPPFSIAIAGPPRALTVSREVAALREWLQERLIRRKMEEIRRLEEQRRRMEERARKLEEEERRRRERLERQQAENIISRLQKELSTIRANELQREQRKAAMPQTPDDVTLRQLILQATEDEAPATKGKAATRADGKAMQKSRPASAERKPEKTTTKKPATPNPEKGNTAHEPRPQRQRQKSRPKGEDKPARPRQQPGATGKRETPTVRQQARQRRQRQKPQPEKTEKPAAPQKKPATPRRGPRVLYKPLTNWNRLAPSRSAP